MTMSCFDWHNRASDHLDGTLVGAQKSEADEHLENCDECAERFKHYRVILNSLASQSRSALPVPIRKSPLSGGVPKLGLKFTRSRWEQIPWYLRTSFEGIGIVLMILLGISAGPKLRGLYEKSVEMNLEDFTQSFREWRESRNIADTETPLTRGKAAAPASTDASGPAAPSELVSDDSEESSAANDQDDEDDSIAVEGGSGAADEKETRAGANEIWRFMLKTDSPHELRGKIVKILTGLRIPANTSGIGGIEAPGGIQFDLLVSSEIVQDVKRELQAIAPKPPAEFVNTPAGETFTWYKNKAKTHIPPQKTRIVIWLSQM